MGTASTTAFIVQSGGIFQEQKALTTSSGAGDAQKIPALNDAGVLDRSILNATSTSVGAGDAGKTVVLDGSGRIAEEMMPVGIGADVQVIVASESLSAGDLVNIWNDAGTPKVRKADASMSGKDAHGYVITGVSSGANATVYFEGTNTQVTGLTAGTQFLSATTAGRTTSTAPTGAGKVVQVVGFATSATTLNFQSRNPIVLA